MPKAAKPAELRDAVRQAMRAPDERDDLDAGA
jgi:hypothetical protein